MHGVTGFVTAMALALSFGSISWTWWQSMGWAEGWPRFVYIVLAVLVGFAIGAWSRQVTRSTRNDVT